MSLMDISKITDINTLKVMAYDALVAKEQAEQLIRAIGVQIGQLQSSETVKKENKNGNQKMD